MTLPTGDSRSQSASHPTHSTSHASYQLAGQPVGRIGFGAMQLPGPGVLGPPRDHDEAIAVVRRAIDLGVNHIDTAQFYGPDVANELIREALHPYPEDLVIVTKVGARRNETGDWLPAQHPDELRADVEANLRALGIDQLGAVNLRLLDSEEVAASDRVQLEDQLAALAALREEGKIAGVGISNASLDQVEQAIEQAQITCVQNAFNLVDQRDTPTVERCFRAGIAYVPFFPLGSAFPNLPKVTEQSSVIAVAERLQLTPAQVGLAWLLARSDNILLIPGTSSLEHLEENMAVATVHLSAQDLDEADQT